MSNMDHWKTIGSIVVATMVPLETDHIWWFYGVFKICWNGIMLPFKTIGYIVVVNIVHLKTIGSLGVDNSVLSISFCNIVKETFLAEFKATFSCMIEILKLYIFLCPIPLFRFL